MLVRVARHQMTSWTIEAVGTDACRPPPRSLGDVTAAIIPAVSVSWWAPSGARPPSGRHWRGCLRIRAAPTDTFCCPGRLRVAYATVSARHLPAKALDTARIVARRARLARVGAHAGVVRVFITNAYK